MKPKETKKVDPMLIPKAITKMKRPANFGLAKFYREADIHCRQLSFSQHRHAKPGRVAEELEEVFDELLEFVVKEIDGREYVQSCPVFFCQAEDYGELCTRHKGWNFMVRYSFCQSNMEWTTTCIVFYKITEPLTFLGWLRKIVS